MAVKKVRLRPYNAGTGKQAWEKKSTNTRQAEDRKASEETLKALSEHDETRLEEEGGVLAPTTETGMKSLASKSSENVEHQEVKKPQSTPSGGELLKLPKGTRVVGVSMHVYGKASTAAANVFRLSVTFPVVGNLGNWLIESTTVQWYSHPYELTAKQKEELSEKVTSEAGITGAEIAYEQLTSTANRSEVFKAYVEIEYEEESGTTPATLVMLV